MNTDMIPKGDRNDIETEVKLLDEDETNFNEVLAAIAGRKLFDWLKNLLMSRKYHLGSVFSLVPDFKNARRNMITTMTLSPSLKTNSMNVLKQNKSCL